MGFHPDVPKCELPRWRHAEQRAAGIAERKLHYTRRAAGDARREVRKAERNLAEVVAAAEAKERESEAAYEECKAASAACTAAQFPPRPRKGCGCAACVAAVDAEGPPDAEM